MKTTLIVSNQNIRAFKEAADTISLNIYETKVKPDKTDFEVHFAYPHELYSLGIIQAAVQEKNNILDKWNEEIEFAKKLENTKLPV